MSCELRTEQSFTSKSFFRLWEVEVGFTGVLFRQFEERFKSVFKKTLVNFGFLNAGASVSLSLKGVAESKQFLLDKFRVTFIFSEVISSRSKSYSFLEF